MTRFPAGRRFATLALAWLPLACGPSEEDKGAVTEPVPALHGSFRIPTDLDGARGFLDVPFPSDIDVRPDGTRVVQTFPNPTLSTVLEDYRAELSKEPGWQTNGAMFMGFEADLDPALLPTPAQSMLADSPIQLVVVDAQSPYLGERIPLRLRVEQAETLFVPIHTLVALPVLGIPLRPATTYALVEQTSALSADGLHVAPSPQLAMLLADQAPSEPHLAHAHAAYAPLRQNIEAVGLHLADVGNATVFTTLEPLHEMAAGREVVVRNAPYATANWQKVTENSTYTQYQGTIALPIFPQGTAPWSTFDGVTGRFKLDANGDPIAQGSEEVVFALTVPRGTQPSGGWPVVVVAHGTGGSYRSFLGTGNADEAAFIARAGCAAVSISQPIHFSRNGFSEGLEEINTFNFLNPNGAKGIWRQAALESIALFYSLQTLEPPLGISGGTEPVVFNHQLHLFFGHSQGGITGSLMAGVEKDLDLAILSGAGGGFAESLLEKKEPVVIANAVRLVLSIDENEPLDEFHPVLTFMQLLGEQLEPLNAFSHTFDVGHKAPNILIFSGQTDAHTPPRTHAPLAAVAGIPPLAPLSNPSPAFTLRNLNAVPGPVTLNMAMPTDRHATAVLAQFPGNHFTVYQDPVATGLAQSFLSSFISNGQATAQR